MLFSAVSAIGLSLVTQAQAPAQDPLWGRLQRSVVEIQFAAEVSGVGVLIDNRGYFLAHSNSVSPIGLSLGMIGGRLVSMSVLKTDAETQMSLLRADAWKKEFGTPIRVAPQGSAVGERLLAVTVKGPVRAELTSKSKVGQMRPSLRYAPLSEITLEGLGSETQGALAFNSRGELVGVLGAALAQPSRKAASGFGGGGFGNPDVEIRSLAPTYGPGAVTIGYAIGPDLLDRVVDGFRTPNHEVRHPTIGVFFKTGPKGGAIIEAVMPGSTAFTAGIALGDVIREAGGTPIKTPVDLAVVLFDQRVGGSLELKVERNGEIYDVTVEVGSTSESELFRKSSMFQRNVVFPL